MSKEAKESSGPPFWKLSWWLPKLTKEDRQDCCRRVSESSAPTPPYYVLIVLSTLISSYGLLSNSTATVIGAMIVAPLMGPILGLALGIVLADGKMFRRGLIAESTGVLLVILTGLLVALVAGPDHIDFAASEIAGRTKPTLFDFAIGIAAGLAGGYCTVHPGLQASVAGVAIAVALVPPLAVTGITASGYLYGYLGLQPVFGSFMLFFTNLLTIELSSGLVFFGTGFRRSREDRPKEVWARTLAIKGVLLLLTGWFLTVQLTRLVQERYGLSTSRKTLQSLLKGTPGADLDSIEAHLKGNKLEVQAVVGSRTDIVPEMVDRFESRIAEQLKEGLPGVDVDLIIRTVNSTYASSSGYLFEPVKLGMDDDERRLQSLEVVLRELLVRFPGVELVSFHPGSSKDKANNLDSQLALTLSTPYDFGPRFVSDLERELNDELAQDSLFSGYSYELLVRSIIVRKATADKAVAEEVPEMRTDAEKALAEREDTLRRILTDTLESEGNLRVTELHLRRFHGEGEADSGSSSRSYMVRAELRSPKLLGTTILAAARERAQKAFEEETGEPVELSLETISTVGTELFVDREVAESVATAETSDDKLDEALAKALNNKMRALVGTLPGATLEGEAGLQKSNSDGAYRMFAVITTPKALSAEQVAKWQASLVKSSGQLKSLELRVENRLGQTLNLAPLKKPQG